MYIFIYGPVNFYQRYTRIWLNRDWGRPLVENKEITLSGHAIRKKNSDIFIFFRKEFAGIK